MTLRIEPVDAFQFADEAGEILREVWQPPCMLYSSEYLRWQFSFPGDASPLAVAAFDGATPVAFVAAVPRWMRLAGKRTRGWVSSFHSARLSYRGPAAVAIVRMLSRMLRELSSRFISFAEPGGDGEQLLVRTALALGFAHRFLGEYRTYGCVPPVEAAYSGAVAEATNNLEEFDAVCQMCDRPTTLYSAPDRRQLEHYLSDPRRRALVLVRDDAGRPLGAAMVIRSEVCTHRGLELVSSIDVAFFPSPSAAALRAVAIFAARQFGGDVTSRVVTAANLAGVDATCLRSAGFRATQGRFAGHLFSVDPTDPILAAETTNHEIV